MGTAVLEVKASGASVEIMYERTCISLQCLPSYGQGLHSLCLYIVVRGRVQLKCDGTHAETRFRLSAKRTSPFKSAGRASVQSTTDSRGVRIRGSNAGYTIFRGSVKSTGYPLHQFPHHFPSLRHRVLSHLNWSLI